MKQFDVPLSWSWKSLEDVANPEKNAIVDGPFGSNLKVDDYVETGIPVLQGKNITNDTFKWKEVRYITSDKAEELKRSSVKVGDILIVKIGSIGYSAILDSLNDHPYAKIPANLAKVSPNLCIIDTGYLHRWLTSEYVKSYLMNRASKTSQPALSLGKIKEIPIPLPPLPEQKRIDAILDKADAIRRKRAESLRLADDFLKSAFLDMFGDPVTNPKGWEVVKLQDICKRITDGTHQPPKWSNDGVPFLFVSNVVDGQLSFKTHKYISMETWLELTKRCPIEVNDILYTIVGSYGNAALVTMEEPFAFQRHIAHIKPDSNQIHPEFLHGMLDAPPDSAL